MNDLKPTFEHYYPEGIKGGQCAAFAEKLIKFGPVGNPYISKLNYFKKYGSTNLSDIKVGDVVLTDDSKIYGHIFIVNCDLGDKWRVTESNFNFDERVHHTRLVAKNSSRLKAHVRSTLLVKIINSMITLKVKLVANNAQWPSMAAKIAEIKQRLEEASSGRLTSVIDVEYTNFTNIPFVPTVDPNILHVDPVWFDQNVTPRGIGYQFVTLLVLPQDAPLSGISGIMEDHDQGPVETYIKTREDETMSSPNYTMNNFVNTLLHENFGHGLRVLTGQPDLLADGSYLVHQYLDNAHGIFKLKELLDLLDYSKLSQPNGTGEFMVYFKVKGKTALYELAHESWRGYDDNASYQQDIAGKTVKIIELDQAEFNKLPQLHPI